MKTTKLDQYFEYLKKQNIHDDAIERDKAIIKDFVNFLGGVKFKKILPITEKEMIIKYARKLIDEKRNTLKNFSVLCNYTKWMGQIKLYVALIEIMDCHNALEVLSDKIKDKYGSEIHDLIFCEELPPLGVDEKKRLAFTKTIMKKMEQQLTPQEIQNLWFLVQHGIPPDDWNKNDTADREKYKRCRNIDEFFNLKLEEKNAMLTCLRNEGKLWYTIEINDQVLEFIKSNPEMEGGRREGNRIYITKIPYNVIRYLNETDIRMKRYFACHCPLVREAILDNQNISSDICCCSLGHASHYLAGLDMEIKGEVLESVISGDMRCRFVFYIP